MPAIGEVLVAVTGDLQPGLMHESRGLQGLSGFLVGHPDDGELAKSGSLRLSADAADVAREYFARELELSSSLLGGEADEIAAAADITAYPSAPAYDTRTGARYDRPTVRIAAQVPVRTPVFGALVLRPVTTIEVLSVSSPR